MTCTHPTTSLLRANLAAVRRRIAVAALAAGRDPARIQLLPVTKSVPVEVAAALAALGEADLAENRADGLQAKAAALPGVRWHFIGTLQRNKARRIARVADVVHSVDSVRLVETLERVAVEEGRRLEIYLQVDLTGEATKHGLDEGGLTRACERAAAASALDLLGLMAMAPRVARPGRDAAAVFGQVAALGAQVARHCRGGRCRLSLGMSDDLEAAVAAGSTCVRVGGALFEGPLSTGEARP